MRLLDSLAARSRFYPRPISSTADILLLDIPIRYASKSLPLRRFYPILVETPLERIEIDRFLGAERPELVVPNLLDRRPSTLQSENITLVHYDPGEADWPWILLCQWPRAFAAAVPQDSDFFARRAYTVEIFSTVDDRDAGTKYLMASLASNGLAPIFIES